MASALHTAFSIIGALLLAVGASLCSGLNLGMLALDKMRMEALLVSGT